MIAEVFYWILNLSILGSFTGLIVLLIGRIKKIPRFGVYLLWILPFVRLWIPFGIANKYSLLNFIAKYTTETVVVNTPISDSVEISLTNTILAATNYFPMTFKTDLLKVVFYYAGIIWIIGVTVAIISSVVLYILTKNELKDSLSIKDNIYSSDKVLSPAIYGIIKPKVILPADIAAKDLQYVLKHEQLHIKRKDNLWRIVAVITACIHWFNPLSWLFVKHFFIDMELACDVGVLNDIDQVDKQNYAATLLNYSATKNYYASAFGGTKTRLRIENILSYKKLTLFSSFCFVLLFIVITITVITNAVKG